MLTNEAKNHELDHGQAEERDEELEKLVELRDATDQAIAARKRTRGPRKRSAHAVPRGPEVRFFDVASEDLEFRTEDEANPHLVTIVGEPIVYNTPYSVRDQLGEFQETMLPGVAKRALESGADVRFLINHDMKAVPMASSGSGTMTFQDTPTGLQFRAVVDTRQTAANDLVIALERGVISKMSVGFTVAPGGDKWTDGLTKRSISDFGDFLDVSAVNIPASATTSISLAQRMASQMPSETTARIAKLCAELRSDNSELRAGKVLSQQNHDALSAALDLLHGIMSAAVPTEADSESEEDGTDTAAGNTDSDVESVPSDDGTEQISTDLDIDAEEHPADEDLDEVPATADASPISAARSLELERELLELRARR